MINPVTEISILLLAIENRKPVWSDVTVLRLKFAFWFVIEPLKAFCEKRSYAARAALDPALHVARAFSMMCRPIASQTRSPLRGPEHKRGTAMSETFNPDDHNLFETHYFEDFNVGDSFPIPSRTMTDANFQVFSPHSLAILFNFSTSSKNP